MTSSAFSAASEASTRDSAPSAARQLSARTWRLVLLTGFVAGSPTMGLSQSPRTVRFATFNVSLSRDRAGALIEDLQTEDHEQIRQIAEIIQRIRPDVLLLNEFDFDRDGVAAKLFQENYLGRRQREHEPIHFAYRYLGPVNTGEPSGQDLDQDGSHDGPGDAFGFGRFPGQYGMLVLSRFPIETRDVRTIRTLLWKEMPRARLPRQPESGRPFYSATELSVARLSSKAHWDLPIRFGTSRVHFLVSHPTPPVFDGPEDRNGCRNHDEIRLLADYIDPSRSGWVRDDRGTAGGLPAGARFVIAGDLNADPVDGASVPGAMRQLLDHPRVGSDFTPTSAGGREQALRQGGVNERHRGESAADTADFDDARVGNLRVDYVLPDRSLRVTGGGVFWPAPDSDGADLVGCSDHRLVWIDVRLR